MDRRARCWVFRYCFTLYRDHQSNAFLYSLSRSIILCCPLLLSSCDKRDHILNLDRLHLHLDFNPYLTLRLAPLAPIRWTRTSSHSKHTESQASDLHRNSFCLSWEFLFHCGVGFLLGLDTSSYSKVLFSLSVLLWHHQGAQGQPVASMPSFLRKLMDKQTEITMFSSTAIALYGYDQGK